MSTCCDCSKERTKHYEPRKRAFAGWGTPRAHPRHPLASFMSLPDTTPCRAEALLFRTVILQAIYEACGGDAEARYWLLNPGEDLNEVCDYARVLPDFIQRVTLQLLAGQLAMPDWRVWRYLWQPTLEAVR